MTRRMPAGARRAGMAMLSAATVSLVLAGPAAAHDQRRAAAVIDPVRVAAAECNVISPSYCLVAWDTAEGTFVATGIHADGGALVLDGLFTGSRTTPWPHLGAEAVDVQRQAASVPVGAVTVTRRAVVLKGANWPSNCGITGASCTIETNAIDMTDTSLGDTEPMSYREQPFAVTGHPSRTSAKHASRDWRRARTAAARAAVLQRLLFAG